MKRNIVILTVLTVSPALFAGTHKASVVEIMPLAGPEVPLKTRQAGGLRLGGAPDIPALPCVAPGLRAAGQDSRPVSPAIAAAAPRLAASRNAAVVPATSRAESEPGNSGPNAHLASIPGELSSPIGDVPSAPDRTLERKPSLGERLLLWRLRPYIPLSDDFWWGRKAKHR